MISQGFVCLLGLGDDRDVEGLSDVETLARTYWRVIAEQNPDVLKGFFVSDAYVRWHNTNEEFTVDEFVRANCEYPGSWNGVVERLEFHDNLLTTVTHVWAKDNDALSFHVVSFIILNEEGKITGIDEYWGDDGPVPQWRLDKRIGTPIR